MAFITKTKMQKFFGSVAAFIILIIFVSVASAMLGYRLPGLSMISDAMGIATATE